ncbi:hypothetical protein JCM3774_003868 [Rhodotorula dairenensis]
MAEALMLRAPTSRLANQIRTHARVLASLKLRPSPGEYTLAARPEAVALSRLTDEERVKLDRLGARSTGNHAAAEAAVEPESLLSTGKTALHEPRVQRPVPTANSSTRNSSPPLLGPRSRQQQQPKDEEDELVQPALGRAPTAAWYERTSRARARGQRARSRSPGREKDAAAAAAAVVWSGPGAPQQAAAHAENRLGP